MSEMKFNPVAYKHFERMPVGCFSAELTADGWANTKFDHDLQEHLLSDEVSEFVRLVRHIFTSCSDFAGLSKGARKHGTEIRGEDGRQITAINYDGEVLDYTVHIDNTKISVFPYRKYQH